MTAIRGSLFSRQQGVALVVTVILITVITFLAIAFLALSRREKGAVSVTTDQTIARLAAEAGLERAKAEMLAPILATTNAFNFGLGVSTNFINWSGFDPAALDQRTNVNYDYRVGGGPLSPNDALQNVANLLYSPRPPVFVTNRLFGRNEFRFYLDLNRNDRYDPSGPWPVIGPGGGYLYPDGTEGPDPTRAVTNFFVGDPEWVGILARPDLPHSSSNWFVSRFAYVVVPAGKTLDINYIHNQAARLNKLTVDPLGRDFFRNQGVGSWEINLAAFLYDLNTNTYAWGEPYFYDPLGGFPINGNAFVDAGAIYRYRLNGPKGLNYDLRSVAALFGANGVAAFGRDLMDGYSTGPALTSYRGYPLDPDVNPTDARTRPWPGAYNTNHFFTTQDLFDTNKTSGFAARLANLGTNQSSYDRYTFYRLLSQLGTDSAPEPDTKLHLNYVNVGGFKATNFISWDDPIIAQPPPVGLGRRGSEIFFTNAADRLLRRFSADWLARDPGAFLTTFGTNRTFGAGQIPVFVNGRFAYSPSVHRQLQLAANLFDAGHPRVFPGSTNAMPTVFRPRFTNDGANVFIQDFVEVNHVNELAGATLRDLSSTNAVAAVRPDDLIFGVPLVIGARKGLPNFNEFAMESVFQITRKVELRKRSNPPGGASDIVETNQMFTVGISNALGAEFWNSYATPYPRAVDLYVTNYVSMLLTNDFGVALGSGGVIANPLITILGARAHVPANFWRGWNETEVGGRSFLVPMRTNLILLADSAYQQNTRQFVPQAQAGKNANNDFILPRWGLTLTNRLHVMVVDSATGRLIDFALLNGLTGYRDLTGEIAQGRPTDTDAAKWLWSTNAVGPYLSDQPGVLQQILVSLGYGNIGDDWNSYGIGQAQGQTRLKEIAKFMAFFTTSHIASYGGFSATNVSQVAVAPFSPTRKISVPMSWQANDPLVHYTPGDLLYLEQAGTRRAWNLRQLTNHVTLENIGKRNNRYQPWAQTDPDSDANSVNPAYKDAGVTRSDLWEFPTNKFPTIGWLGRVHRGTPWQTLYLKASGVDEKAWREWTGNRDVLDARRTQPRTDHDLLDLFTTALNENAVRGQLPINQTNLAAWSAVFSGVIALQGDTNAALSKSYPGVNFAPYPIPPAGSDPNAPLRQLVNAINDVRATNFAGGVFHRLGDLLKVPELTERSPFLNLAAVNKTWGVNDAVYEWLPQQMLSLVRLGEPRFVVYAFGQTLKPAPNGFHFGSGPFNGLCTNYQVVAEAATRAVVRVDTGGADFGPGVNLSPRVVVESYNLLPPD